MTSRLTSEHRWALVAVALAVAIAVLDYVTPPEEMFLGLLVVPPLIASATVQPSTTCWIALLSLVEAVALGAHEHIWLGTDHVTRVIAVAAAGVLGVGLALERRETRRTLGATYRISEAAHEAGSLQELYRAIHGIVAALMPARNFYIALHDAERGSLSFPYFVDEFDAPPASKPLGRGMTEYVLRTGEPLLGTPGVFADLVRRGEVEPIGAPSIDWLGAPLEVEGKTIGVLVLQSYTERVRYSERHKRTLQFVSTQVAMAIERVRAEEALRRSEAQYRDLVDVAPELIGVHSGGKFVFINEAGARMLGASRSEEIVGRPVMDFVHPVSRPVVGERIHVMLERGKGVPLNLERLVRLDGTPFDAEVAAIAVQYRDKPAVQVWARDVTERQHAEAALRASETRLSEAQAIAHLGVWELDLTDLKDVDANPLWWSDETFRIFGYEPGSVKVTNALFFDAVHRDDKARIQAAVAQSLSDGTPYFIEHRIVRPDGAERIVREQSTVLRDASGRPLRMMGTVLDVTEQRRLEEQLRQAQKMEAVGQLAGGLAHDFNNLLTTILTMSQMLQADLRPDSPLQADLDAIRGAAQHGSELTRKLLAFSRHQRLELRAVAVGPLVDEFARMARRVVPEDVELVLETERRGTTVVADPAALEQILMNLVTNARDAMPTGGRMSVAVTCVVLSDEDCRAHGQGTPGSYVVLTVADNGTGMDAETQRRMFEPFFTTKPVGEGTGLGMPIVYGLVKEHGGFVRTYSELGSGTTIKVYLPAAAEDAAPGGRAVAERRGGTETILLVEDDEALRRSGTRVLTRYGYTVITASNGAEALELVRSRRTAPDLIVSDVVMPQASGPELLQSLREAGVGAKVLFTSGYPARDVRERTPLEPDVPFLAKPWTIDDLIRRVREVLDAPAAT